MKTISRIVWLWLLIPLYTQAQHVTEYRPNGGVLVSSIVNLESLRGTNPLAGDAAPGYTRSVNTVQEAAGAAPNDIWFLTSNQAGGVVNTIRFGNAGINERASALEVCANGEYIILGVTAVGGLDRILAFRITPAGAIIWAFTYNVPNGNARGYCIKRTNDANESFVIAGSLSQPNTADKTLLAFEITGGGAMVWNSTYFDPVVPNNIFDQPRSMVVVNNVHYIAGNRTQGAAQDIFTIAIDQVAGGAIAIPYAYLDNNNLPDVNPYINVSNAGGFVLVYSTVAPFAGVVTGRVSFTPLGAGLAPLAATTFYSEPNTTNNYGHTIYPAPGGVNYDIGGGVTAAQNNPSFFTIGAAGNIIAGSYRRLWAAQNFVSTFMLRDPATAGMPNFYAHHNYRPTANPNGMSVMRNNAACFVNPPLQLFTLNNIQIVRPYNRNAPLMQQPYGLANPVLNGQFFTCGGGAGVFKTQVKGEPEEPVEAGSFKVYPTLVTGQAPLNISMEALQDAEAVITIYNMEAKPVLQTKEKLMKGNNHIQVDINTVLRGTFIVEIITGDRVLKARIIKQ